MTNLTPEQVSELTEREICDFIDPNYWGVGFDYDDANDLLPFMVCNQFKIDVSKNMVIVEDGMFGFKVERVFYDMFTEKDCNSTRKVAATNRACAECLYLVLQEKAKG